MNKLLATIAALIASTTINAADKNITVKLTNPLPVERKSTPVVVPLDATYTSAKVTINGTEVPCQLDDLDDDGIYDELAFLADLGKKASVTATVTLSTEGEPRHYDNRTYGYLGIRDRQSDPKKQKHQPITSVTFPKDTNPYNYIFPHGAVMENDMVGYRVYCDHRQSIDYYGHRQHKMDIAETAFYTSQQQRDQGYGEDVLYTGSTYGCGCLHGWDPQNSKAIMFENVRNRTQTVVCQGPVRTILDITNRGWQPITATPASATASAASAAASASPTTASAASAADSRPLDIRTRYILYYGHRDVEVQVKFSRNVADIPLSTGIVDIIEGSEEFTDHAGLRADWGRACAGNNPQVYDTITVGLGIYVPKEYYRSDSHFTDGKERLPNQAYVQVCGTQTDNLHYWFASTCDIETFGFAGPKEWFAYLQEWKKQLLKPVKIEIK